MTQERGMCNGCDGCGKIANDDDATPWTYWENLPESGKLAVRLGVIFPRRCPRCDGTGFAKEIAP